MYEELFWVITFYFLIPSATLWDIFTYTLPQMKVLKFNYMSTKQVPVDLTCAYFWCQGSENSSQGSDSLSPPEQEESGLWLVLGPTRELSAPSFQFLQSNIWKHPSEKQFLQRVLQCETAKDDLASKKRWFALNFPSFSCLTCRTGSSRSESHNHHSSFETALSSFPRKTE